MQARPEMLTNARVCALFQSHLEALKVANAADGGSLLQCTVDFAVTVATKYRALNALMLLQRCRYFLAVRVYAKIWNWR